MEVVKVLIINKLSNDNFKKNRHKIDTALNNRHSPRGYWDEVKKYVRNVGYLGYILNLRNFFKKENNFFFAMGFKKSEFPYRFFGFSLAGTLLYIVLGFTSSPRCFVLVIHPAIPSTFVEQTSSLCYVRKRIQYKYNLLINLNP